MSESDIIDLCERAVVRLKELGFKKVYQSMKSEARYFHAKGFYGVIRVAFHRHKNLHQTINGMKVTAKITFNKNSPKLSEYALNKLLQQALGVYFVNRYQSNMNAAGVNHDQT